MQPPGGLSSGWESHVKAASYGRARRPTIPPSLHGCARHGPRTLDPPSPLVDRGPDSGADGHGLAGNSPEPGVGRHLGSLPRPAVGLVGIVPRRDVPGHIT